MIHWKVPSADRWKNILFNSTLALNCLLCFLLIFENRLNIPPWLQVAGRMHPLILHFPIVLLILFALQVILGRGASGNSPATGQSAPDNSLLLFTAFTAAITAIAGLLLSREPGYDQDALQAHKYSGIALSLLTVTWYAWYDQIKRIKRAPLTVTAASLCLLIFAGHQGSGITHGRDFLLAPVTPPARHNVSLEQAQVFTDMVQPILETKCMTCHNSRKAKGELSMETLQLLLRGGKSGPIFDTTSADLGLLMQRIHLPQDQKKHMPPIGKPQLDDNEMTILYQWLKHDPAHPVRIADLPDSDTLRILAATLFQNNSPAETYDFSPANEKTIAKLNTDYRVVYPIAAGSPALAVDFYGPSAYKSDQLKALDEVKTQVVSVNLDKMPVTDADLAFLHPLTNLRKLQLSSTSITGSGLDQLSSLKHLKILSLSNTTIKASDLDKLATLKELRSVFIWNTHISAGEASAFTRRHPALDVETGSHTDTMHIRLNPPILRNDQAIIDSPVNLRLKHFVPGATIRYTIDGSDPDSANSILYNATAMISGLTTLKVRAFKPGWLPSDILQYQFYHSTFKPDTIILQLPADSLYKGQGSKTLYNHVKGDLNFGSGKWLGFHGRPMACLLEFSHPVKAASVAFSSLVDRGSLILPPQNIDIYGGNDPHNLKKLAHLTPDQPATSQPAFLTYYECRFPATAMRYIRIEATAVPQLPTQLVTKENKKGWFFVDEVFVN